jgi:type IV pilus assembly protein PilA
MRILKRAFSLIELMVVIAIIGLLSAIAIPMYSQYTTRAYVETAIPVMQGIISQLEKSYESTGAYPNSITFSNNLTITSGNWTSVNFGNIDYVVYYLSSDLKGAAIEVAFIPGHSITSPATNFLYAVRDINGTMKSVCGGYGNSQDVPAQYLPSNCTCFSIEPTEWIETGTGC